METKVTRLWRTHQLTRHVLAITCAFLLVSDNLPLFAQQTPRPVQQPAQQQQQTAPQPGQQPAANVKIPADQLDALVAPIALYPDPLLSQTLVASTYPLEIIQLQQWLERNPGLKDQALVNAVSKEPWDPSIKAMAALPDVVKRLATDIQWTTDLGNAFLAQESDVMNADEVAAFLGVDRTTVYDFAGRGEIPHQRLGKRLLFRRGALVSWLDSSLCQATSTRKG